MVEGIFWNIESWGITCPPVNADEIINAANRLIDKYLEDHHLDLNEIYDFDDAFNYSCALWYDFCCTDYINGITAIYEEE